MANFGFLPIKITRLEKGKLLLFKTINFLKELKKIIHKCTQKCLIINYYK